MNKSKLFSPLQLLTIGLFAFFGAQSATYGQTPQNAMGFINVLDFGAVPDSVTDNTAAFQRAIDSAAVTGTTVYVPAGLFLIAGSLWLENVSLVGQTGARHLTRDLSGTVILATGGRGNENAKPLFHLAYSASVKGLSVYYPEQTIDSVQPYPWTFYIGHDNIEFRSYDCIIEDITLINSYNGICTGPNHGGRHIISNIGGCVLRRGISVESVTDIGRIKEVQFHCVFWSAQSLGGGFWKVFNYMQANLEAFILGRTDWEYMTNTFVFPAKIGYHFIRTTKNKDWKGGPNGQFSGMGADATGIAVLIDDIQPMGLLITNGEFNSHQKGEGVEILITEKCKGSIRFENCAFWGSVNHNAVIKGDCYVSFNNCYFSNNFVTDQYSIVAENGKLQINSCTFDATESHEINGVGGGPGVIAWPPYILNQMLNMPL